MYIWNKIDLNNFIYFYHKQRKRDEDEITKSQWEQQTNNLARLTQLKERELERNKRFSLISNIVHSNDSYKNFKLL